MAAGIVYLDVDDEITSAASRIRSSPGTKVALVVPYGSRIATSRMNFRLLSREALVSNRRLSIVAGDAAARSLAASAGLPVFATVSEYEASVPERAAAAPVDPEPGSGETAVGEEAAVVTSATIVAAAPAAALAEPVPSQEEPTTVQPSPAPRRSQRPRRPPPAEPTPAARLAAPDAAAVAPAESLADDEAIAAGLPPLFGTRIRGPIAAAIALVTLGLVVAAVGAYVLLPSATIVVTPRREPIGPIQLSVSADPDATSADPANLVVPAVRVEVPVEVSRTFRTTGVHVEQTAATGSVTFENYNPLNANTIAAGSIVSTEGGVRFRTKSSVTLPPGTFVLPSVIPSRRSVDVTAVSQGPGGNVPANAIRVVPQGENPDFLKVNNPDATAGGSKTETPEVTKAEVDKALATLQTDLQAAFEAEIAAGAGAPAGATLFPATAVLGSATPDVDPQSFVGQPIESFDIRLTATGTVIAVDPRPVQAIAESQIASKVTPGHELVPGSAQVDVGDGLVGEDGSVTFPATARATEVAIVDGAALRELVKGKTAAEARAALQPYGDATVTLWPDWASTVTGLDSRLSVTVAGSSPDGSGAGGSPASSAPSTARPPRSTAAPSSAGVSPSPS